MKHVYLVRFVHKEHPLAEPVIGRCEFKSPSPITTVNQIHDAEIELAGKSGDPHLFVFSVSLLREEEVRDNG